MKKLFKRFLYLVIAITMLIPSGIAFAAPDDVFDIAAVEDVISTEEIIASSTYDPGPVSLRLQGNSARRGYSISIRVFSYHTF